MAKIFIVEDNSEITKAIKAELKKWQYETATVNNWKNVAKEISTAHPDLILFDITLPSFDGFYWIQEVRKVSQVPIIIISAADIDANVMHAVSAGADDYLMKPFSMTVMLAKIQALLRRQQSTLQNSELSWDHNHFNSLTNTISNHHGTVQLTPTEGALLQVLFNHHPQAVTKNELLEWLWQGGKYLNTNTLNVNISRLRAKLNTIGLHGCIVTERGVGYRLVTANE